MRPNFELVGPAAGLLVRSFGWVSLDLGIERDAVVFRRDDARQNALALELLNGNIRGYTDLMPPDRDCSVAAVGELGDCLPRSIFGPGGLTIDLPAAYTYLGQFIAHDVSHLRIEDDGTALRLKSAKIDLGSIFNYPSTVGPGQPATAGHIEAVLPLGRTRTGGAGTATTADGPLLDLCRAADGTPHLADRRNDQNLAVAQMTVAITRFARHVAGQTQGTLADVQRVAAYLYQSVIAHDFLDRLVPPAIYHDVMTRGRVLVRPSGDFSTPFHVPIEFATAVFRFGHSLIRGSYGKWNASGSIGSVILHTLVQQTGTRLEYGRLAQRWAIDWNEMLGSPPGTATNRASRIDTSLSKGVFDRERRLFFPEEEQPLQEPLTINLARRTLESGCQVGLPSGQALAGHVNQVLGTSGRAPLDVLTADQIAVPGNDAANACIASHGFAERTPLWLYVLLEAERLSAGERLGPLAARIVAETLSAAIEASGSGLIQAGVLQPFTAPAAFPGRQPGRFDLHDLVALATKPLPDDS